MSDTPGTLTIDGVGPMPVERPASVAELCDLVRRCAADGTAIYPVGGGTMLDYGTPPARPGVAVSTAQLDQVIDFPARDMTITAQAGVTLAKLRELTTAEGLWLPVDVPDPDRATLGGAIAANVSGPRRYGYGTLRDYVIGISLVNDRGEETKAGGRVVKNVAGYDLMKLYTGSLGTLGVITQVTLKLRPVPETWAVCLLRGRLDGLAACLDGLNSSATRPVGIDLSGPGIPDLEVMAVMVRFEGSRDAVEWQVGQLYQEVSGQPFRILSVARDDGPMGMPDPLEGPVIARASLRPSGVADFCRTALTAGIRKMSGPAGRGVVRVSIDCSSAEEAQTILDVVQQTAVKYDGNVIIDHCPTDWKRSLRVWGRPPADLGLQKAVKRALDPNGIFNPGRFVTDAF
jgi:glycolate oxidase FAD binding subunit